MSRRRRKSRVKRRRRRLNILVGIICIGVVAFAGVTAVRMMQKNNAKQTASTDTTATTDKKESADQSTQKGKDLTKPLTIETEDTSDEAAQAEELDRSDFAVQPGRTVGTTEQSDEKVVYLTLDDGPSQNTQKVLDILDKYNAKATFFVTGAMPEYKDMIKVAYDKGHTIGMHTYSHDYAKVYASVDSYFQDLDQVAQIVKEEIGYVPCFIRFPGGSSNTISASYTRGIMSTLTKEVQARGYQYYDWNGSSGDGAVRTTEQLVAQATSFHDNNIVLLSHDSAAKDTTVEALPQIIEYYQSQGYVFKALDLNSYVAHHGVNN